MNRRILASILISMLFGAGLVGCDSEASEMRDDDRRVAPSPVETLVLSSTSFVDTFEVLGSAEPVDSVQVSSDVAGKLLEAGVDEGDAVGVGQTLFRIDTETDEAGQDVLQTQVEAAERELQRMQRLLEEGLATEQQVDNAETELESARRNLRQSQISIGRSQVKSPIQGVVSTRFQDAGEFANAGAPLAEIIDYSTITVYAQVPESQIPYVDADDDVEVDVDIPALDATYTGRVERVALRPSETTRTYTVELHIDNEDLRIRPGMRTRTHFERQSYPEAIVIPRDSILEGFDGREVMVVPGDDDIDYAEVRSIELGPGSAEDVVVTEGLAEGERLILRGHRGLIGDARVEVVDERQQRQAGDEQ